MNHKLPRRQLLKLLATIGAGRQVEATLGGLATTILSGVVQKAQAQQAGLNPRNFINIYLSGGYPRWMFDGFLQPYGATGYVANKQAATRYVASNGRYTDVTYATHSFNGVNYPWQWQFALPTPSGTRPMTDLSRNMLVLQGLNSLSEAHDLAFSNLFLPLGSTQSLQCLGADHSSAPFAGMSHNTAPIWKSKAQKVGTRIGGYDINSVFNEMMTPFNLQVPSTFSSNLSQLKSLMDAAATSLSGSANARNPNAALIQSSKASAVQLMAQSLSTKQSLIQGMYTKYRNLIAQAVAPTAVFAGINDLPVGATENRDTNLYNSVPSSLTDIRSLVTTNIVSNDMARCFAFAEFVITQGLTQSVTVDPRSLYFPGPFYLPDEHEFGVMASVLLHFYNTRAIAACLMELIAALQTANVFNNTIVMVSSEFGRSARANGSGSDHGQNSSSATFFSGAIQGPYVAGNIRGNSTIGGYSGSWGDSDGSRDFGHLLSSVATMLRVPSPLTARPSLVAESGGVISSLLPRTTIV